MSILEQLRTHLAGLTPAQFEREWADIEAMKLQGPTVKEFLDMSDEYSQSLKFKKWVSDNGISYIGQKFRDRTGKILCETRKELYNFCENGYKV